MPDTTKMLFIMSEKQKNEAKEQAGMIGVTTSELFRWKMYYPSPSDTAALYETKASIMRMENRLEEAIHLQTDFAPKLGQGSDEDRNIRKKLQGAENEIRGIHKELEEINETCSSLFEEIKTSDLIALKKIMTEMEVSLQMEARILYRKKKMIRKRVLNTIIRNGRKRGETTSRTTVYFWGKGRKKMGRKDRTKDNSISVRFTNAQKEDIRNFAEKAGISGSEYIRKKALGLDLDSFIDISELRDCFLKTQEFINKLARDYPKSISGADYCTLLQSLDRIDKKITS